MESVIEEGNRAGRVIDGACVEGGDEKRGLRKMASGLCCNCGYSRDVGGTEVR